MPFSGLGTACWRPCPTDCSRNHLPHRGPQQDNSCFISSGSAERTRDDCQRRNTNSPTPKRRLTHSWLWPADGFAWGVNEQHQENGWQQLSPSMSAVVFRFVPEEDVPSVRVACRAWSYGMSESVRELRPTSDSLPPLGWSQRFTCIREVDMSGMGCKRLACLFDDITRDLPAHLERLRLPPLATHNDVDFLGSLPNVTCLDVTGCALLSGNSLSNLFARRCFPRLASLYLDRRHMLSVHPSLSSVFQHVPATMERLELGDYDASSDWAPQFEANAIRNLCWPTSVRHLVLSGQFNAIDDDGLQNLQSMPELTSLTLSGCIRLSDSGLARFMGSASIHLSTLNMSGCHGVGRRTLAALSRRLRCLSHLDLCHCPGILPGDIQDAKVLQLPQLTFLSLSHTSVGDLDIQRLSQLRTLDLSGCMHLSDRGLQPLRQMNSLEKLYLNGCTQLTHATMHTIRRLESLTHLEMARCPMVSDQGLSLFAGMPRLTSLNVAGCQGVDNSALAVMRSLTALASLNLCGCWKVTDDGLLQTLRHNKALTCLGLSHCHGVSENGMSKIRAMPHIMLTSLAFP